MNKQKFFAAAVALYMVLVTQWAVAQHSDVWLVLDGNQTAVSDTDLSTSAPVLVDATTGKFLFTSDFGEFFGGPFLTDDPGFQSLTGVFTPGADLNYRAVGSLKFWNGMLWNDVVPDSERVLIEGNAALAPITAIDVNGVVNAEGFIGQIGAAGSVHKHIDFSIDNSLGSGLPAFGAYMVELQLLVVDSQGSVVHTESESFRVAFNFQLSAEDYDEAIEALTSPPVNVPIPGYALILLALLLVISGRRVSLAKT